MNPNFLSLQYKLFEKILILLAFSPFFFPGYTSALNSVEFTMGGKACLNGAYPTTLWDSGQKLTTTVYGTFCESDKDTGSLISATFESDRFISIPIAGYPNHEGISLFLKSVNDDRQIKLGIRQREPGESGQFYTFELPEDWRRISLRLIAEDKAQDSQGWIAVGSPSIENRHLDLTWLNLKEFLNLVVTFVWIGILLLIIYMGGAYVAWRLGGHRGDYLAAAGLLSIALSGYVVFWVYFCLGKHSGKAATIAILIASFFVMQRWWKVTFWNSLEKKGDLLSPLYILGFAAMIVLSLGFLYGGVDDPLEIARTRFSHSLPVDNVIPQLFAKGIYKGDVPSPLIGDWLSSDRPPLQAAIVLIPMIFSRSELVYQITGVFLQQLWIPSIWIFLRAAGISTTATVLTIGSVLFSGFTLLNGFYIWPKLLAATFIFVMLYGLMLDVRERRDSSGGILTGALVGAGAVFSMLGHGGSFFALAGVALALPFIGWRPKMSFLVTAVSVAVIIYTPWILYQKYYDPPGDRLVKWHLAGMEKGDPDQTAAKSILKAYSASSIKEIYDNKLANLKAAIGPIKNAFAAATSLFTSNNPRERDASAVHIRGLMFFYLCIMFDILLLALPMLPIVFFKRNSGPDFSAAFYCLIIFLFSATMWIVMMFGPGTTSIHQGSYAVPLLGLSCLTLGLYAVRPLLAFMAVTIHAIFNGIIYLNLTQLDWSNGILLDLNRANPFMFLMALFSFVAVITVLTIKGAEKT